ncbi:hypothetical protein [Streptococcus sp. S784/96/1]|uniref:hypothetical protein n=1 Tax=Streptococcus sp. S784/96/1 TaxID=2653499 RepID=UPI001386989D|nr:hypothetical protein [Streptococcus sp. S784/96/1]
MYELLEITIHKNHLTRISFLSDNPSKCYYKDNHFKLLYFKPMHVFLTPFSHSGINLAIREKESNVKGWELVRMNAINLADNKLIAFLEGLELQALAKQKQGRPLTLNDWLLEKVCHGIATEEDTTTFIKMLYFNGYDPTDIIELFARLVTRTDLALHFINELNKITKEGKGDTTTIKERHTACA